jgi:hypothetical protein
MSHPDIPDTPQFNIKVLASFKDALSRQLSEAIKIDLSGGNELNSKSDYTRCKIPRIVINEEEWEVNAEAKRNKDRQIEEERKKNEEDTEKMENALLRGGAAWDIGSKSRNEKRVKVQTGRKAKKAKLEKLVGWEEAGEETLNVRDWLIGKEGEDDVPTCPSFSGTIGQTQSLQQQEQIFRNNNEQGFVTQTSKLGLSISVPSPTLNKKVPNPNTRNTSKPRVAGIKKLKKLKRGRLPK